MIEPTKVYKDMKAWTPEEAADAILGAIVSQDSTVSLAMGKGCGAAPLCHTRPCALDCELVLSPGEKLSVTRLVSRLARISRRCCAMLS